MRNQLFMVFQVLLMITGYSTYRLIENVVKNQQTEWEF